MMQKIGTIRGVDTFGRVVLPVKLRRFLHLKGGDEVAVRLEDQELILEKHRRCCLFCGDEAGPFVRFGEHPICPVCLDKLKAL